MLFSNLITPLALYEYKLVLESMLLDIGWAFDSKSNVGNVSGETYLDYVVYKPQDSFKAELARESFELLTNTDIPTLLGTSRATESMNSITILKQFLLNSSNILPATPTGASVKSSDIEELFADYNKWLSKIYMGESLYSIMASNGRIKFYLLRTFGTTEGFQNHKLIRANPSLVDHLYHDYLQYCRENSDKGLIAEDKLGHAGDNHVMLIGTLIANMKWFISKWVKKQMPNYLSRNTNRGKDADAYDLLDQQYQITPETSDVNFGGVLRDLIAINDCVFNVKGSKDPFYSVISWYQSIYSRKVTLTLTAMMNRFMKNKFNLIPQCEDLYARATFDSMLYKSIFAMSRHYRCGFTGTVNRSRNAMFLGCRDVPIEHADSMHHIWGRFKTIIPGMVSLYRKRGQIDIEQLYLESRFLIPVEKSNMNYEQGKLKNAEYDRILADLRDKYNAPFLPTNIPIHTVAMLLRGISLMVDLDAYLQSEGLTVMDLPTEKEIRAGFANSVTNIQSLLTMRGVNGWKFQYKYHITSSENMQGVILLNDTELMELMKAPRLDIPITDVELPTGNLQTLIDANNVLGELSEVQRQKVVQQQRSVIQSRMVDPIYKPNVTGRDQFITDHTVKQVKISPASTNNQGFTETKIIQFKLGLLGMGYISWLKKLPTALVDEVLAKNSIKRIGKLLALRNDSETDSQLTLELGEAKKAYARLVYARFMEPLELFHSMPLFTGISKFSETYETSDTVFLVKELSKQIVDYKSACYAVGACLLISFADGKFNTNAMVDTELRSIMDAVKAKGLESDVKFDITLLNRMFQNHSKNWFELNPSKLSLSSIEHVDIDKFPDKMNAVIDGIISIQTAIVQLGEKALSAMNNPVLIGGAQTVDFASQQAYDFSARKSKGFTNIDWLCWCTSSGVWYYEPFKPGQLMTSKENRTTRQPMVPLGKIYSPGANEYLIDNEIWRQPQGNQVVSQSYYSIGGTVERIRVVERRKEDKTSGDTQEFINGVSAGLERKLELDYISDTGNLIKKPIIDLQLMATRALDWNIPDMINAALNKIPSIANETTEIKGLSKTLCALVVLNQGGSVVGDMVAVYNDLLATFIDYNVICDLKQHGKLTSLNFEKNNVTIASYSDVFQMLMLSSEQDIQRIQEFLQEIKSAAGRLYRKDFYDLCNIMNVLGISYKMPFTQTGEYHYAVYPLLFKFINGVFTESVRININAILTTFQNMRATLQSLFKLKSIGLKQIQDNKHRFEVCKSLLLSYMDKDEYKLKCMGVDLNSTRLRKMHEKFKVDPRTKMFYNADKQQFFLASLDKPLSMDYSDYNILVSVDGIVLVYRESEQTFYPQLLDAVTQEMMNIILSKG